MPRSGNHWLHRLGLWLLRLQGWRLTGTLPNERQLVVCFAPHTSNRDFILAASLWLALDLRLSYMMKKEAFFWPLGGFFKRIGGIPIDRSRAVDVVTQARGWFQQHDQIWLGITPEGTRSKVNSWKTGFLRIAAAADVPVLLVGMDAPRKTVVVDKLVYATGDHEIQAEEIRQYMRTKFIGINPANQ